MTFSFVLFHFTINPDFSFSVNVCSQASSRCARSYGYKIKDIHVTGAEGSGKGSPCSSDDKRYKKHGSGGSRHKPSPSHGRALHESQQSRGHRHYDYKAGKRPAFPEGRKGNERSQSERQCDEERHCRYISLKSLSYDIHVKHLP